MANCTIDLDVVVCFLQFVGDAGEVIDTRIHKVVARITNLLNTRMFIEIDWAGGVPVATSGRQGIGY